MKFFYKERIPLFAALTLIVILLELVFSVRLSTLQQYAKVKRLYENEIPLLLVHADNALWELRHSIANLELQNGWPDNKADVKEKFDNFKESLSYLYVPAVWNIIKDTPNINQNTDFLNSALEQMAFQLSDEEKKAGWNAHDLLRRIEPISRSLILLHTQVQEYLSEQSTEALHALSQSEQNASYIIFFIILTGAAVAYLLFCESQSAQKSARLARDAEQKNAWGCSS